MSARRIRVRGVVQGVGFRPFVYRLACEYGLCGWVRNGDSGVEIQVEGSDAELDVFVSRLSENPPSAAEIGSFEVQTSESTSLTSFTIRESYASASPSVRVSPDLPICEECLKELFDPNNLRYLYPYINCTNCGPRFSVIENLPYDRSSTTMRHWQLDPFCSGQYNEPSDRRFHAQPIACRECGPHYALEVRDGTIYGDHASMGNAADLLRRGSIVAVKGLGGYHLSCDAHNSAAVMALRERKFRKEKPFAVMVRDIGTAHELVELSSQAESLLESTARPIVLAPAKLGLAGVAPGNSELGVMLPYAPVHHLLFAAGAPDALVMTSANRSSEPIAYRDEDARERLSGITDAFLVGERPIARRVDDSVARVGIFGPALIRRSRGYAPSAVTCVPGNRPILALGADLKNTVTLVVEGQAFVSQHIGDLDNYEAYESFRNAILDLVRMYRVSWNDLTVVHDLHPEYASTMYALELPVESKHAVQHHRAHVSSVMAERQAWKRRAVAISFDGTGYGDDGTIWGGEFFTGSVEEGWTRALHLRRALLPGGDAAARFPVQCAAGFLHQLENLPDLSAEPFRFPDRYRASIQLIEKRVRTFWTSSMGRLFDTVAALLGFTREITYEGQAAIWLEQMSRGNSASRTYPFPITCNELDFRPLLAAIIEDRMKGINVETIARSFHKAIGKTTWDASVDLCERDSLDLVIFSGGVFQNSLLLSEIQSCALHKPVRIWTNQAVPSNDGGISLGQAASVAVALEYGASRIWQEKKFPGATKL